MPKAAGPETNLVMLLDRVDGPTRTRVVHGLQRERGNAYVQRLLDSVPPGQVKPGPKKFVDFYGVRWSPQASQLRAELEDLIRRRGFRRASEIVGYLGEEAHVQMRIAGRRGETTIWAEILPDAETQFTVLSRERDAALSGFEDAGIRVLGRILDQSEQVLIDEQKRYGLVGAKNERRTVQDNRETAGLVEAVRELIEKRQRAEAASYEARVTGEGFGEDALDAMFEPPDEEGAEGEPVPPGPSGPGDAEVAAGQSAERNQEYERFRSEAQAKYPILNAFADPDSAAKLEELASGQTEPLTRLLGGETDRRLLDIRKLRAAANAGDVSVWELPDLVGRTKEALALPADAYAAKLVDERLADYQGSKSARTLWLSIFAVAVGLIGAIPTGGMSLGAAAAVGAAQVAGVGAGLYLASETVSDYRLNALASSAGLAEKPSTLLLGLELLFTAFDVPGLIKATTALKPLLARAAARRSALAKALKLHAGSTPIEIAEAILGDNTMDSVLGVAARLSKETGMSVLDEIPILGTTPEAVAWELTQWAQRRGLTGELVTTLKAATSGTDRAAALATRTARDQSGLILGLTPQSSQQAMVQAMLRNTGSGPVVEVAGRLSEITGLNVLDEIPIHGVSATETAFQLTLWAERRAMTGELVSAIRMGAGGPGTASLSAGAAAARRVADLTADSGPQAITKAMLRNEGIDPVLEVARRLSAATGENALHHIPQHGVSATEAAFELTAWAGRRGFTPDLVAAIKSVHL